jgi:hypothetical protein
MIMLATATHDNCHFTLIGHLGLCDINGNDPICVVSPKEAKASTNGANHVSLFLTVSLTKCHQCKQSIKAGSLVKVTR